MDQNKIKQLVYLFLGVGLGGIVGFITNRLQLCVGIGLLVGIIMATINKRRNF